MGCDWPVLTWKNLSLEELKILESLEIKFGCVPDLQNLGK